MPMFNDVEEMAEAARTAREISACSASEHAVTSLSDVLHSATVSAVARNTALQVSRPRRRSHGCCIFATLLLDLWIIRGHTWHISRSTIAWERRHGEPVKSLLASFET